ncbi:MAG: transcriptional regulator [Candidatus Competibacter sp.]|nr:transcriptional regulator [Candidatus Competibacter sp.]
MRKLMTVVPTLHERRLVTEKTWNGFIVDCSFQIDTIQAEIAASWQRSLRHLSPRQDHAPLDDQDATKRLWHESPLRQAAHRVLDQLTQLAKEGSLLAAIADRQGRLLWTFASSHMLKRAEAVNFTAGGLWDERSAGTNAVGLALELQRSVTVFSAEHFAPYVHDWVCYAAPIVHPQTGEIMGILDISSTWNLHTPLGQAAVDEFARSIAKNLPFAKPKADLEIYALGRSQVIFRGESLHLTLRQMEILCLLALNPHGLALDALHAALYGDNPVCFSTLKAELSHLRHLLDGQINSRPYRLSVTVWGDFIELWKVLRQKKTHLACNLYHGSFLPKSAAPELEEWRYCIDAVMARALESCNSADVLLEQLCESTSGSELARSRLIELADKGNFFRANGT